MHKRFVMNCILSAAIAFAPMTLHADMVGTQTMLKGERQSAQMELMENFMASEDVRNRMEAMGVDPAIAAERVASLTDSQLQQLAVHLEDAPAGSGALGAVATVLVIILLLEVLGFTNFTRNV